MSTPALNNISNPFHAYMQTTTLHSFHCKLGKTFDPLPNDRTVLEVAKRIALAVIAPFAYLVLGITALLGYLASRNNQSGNTPPNNLPSLPNTPTPPQSNTGPIDGIINQSYYVRFLNLQVNTNANDVMGDLKKDKVDFDKGYHKGTCLYTRHSVQPLAIDQRPGTPKAIDVDYPFAVLIDPAVPLQYWCLQDMDRNTNREVHERAKADGLVKYKPSEKPFSKYHGFNDLHHGWKTIHFSPLKDLEEKIQAINPAKLINGSYKTKGGKLKNDAGLMQTRHNEACIQYNPEQNIKGLLVRNTPQDIAIAKDVKQNYKNNKGEKVLKDAFIAYQSPTDGKIIRIK